MNDRTGIGTTDIGEPRVGETSMDIEYQTRFSFIGQSDWKKARGASDLLSEDRLQRRLDLFETVTLPGMAAQTDMGFRHSVLAAAALPEKWRRRLTDLVTDAVGAHRANVIFADPAPAAAAFADNPPADQTRDGFVARVILDDDDALSVDFNATIRAEASAALHVMRPEHDYCFISFPNGLSLVADPETGRYSLHPRMQTTTALGLTLLAPAQTERSLFRIAHKRITKRRVVRVIYGYPAMYVRGVHGDNDSRALYNPHTLPAKEAQQVIAARFPWLSAIPLSSSPDSG